MEAFLSYSINFDPDSHTYQVTLPPDPTTYRWPSVTTALGTFSDGGDSLLTWAARQATDRVVELASGQPTVTLTDLREICQHATNTWRDVRSTAADIGTAVHATLEAELTDVAWTYPDMESPWKTESVKRAVDAGLRWIRSIAPQPVAVEQALCSPQDGYVGTADLIAKVGSELALIDFKTGSSPHYLKYRLQASAYVRAWNIDERHGDSQIMTRIVVRVGKDGILKYATYGAESQEADEQAFLDSLALFRWKNANDSYSGVDYDEPVGAKV
jgi:hypothetical protein